MADGTGPGRVTTSGIVFGLLMLILIVQALYYFIAQPYWFPPLASVHGREVDQVFGAVLIVTGIAFVVVQGLLGFFVARYGESGREHASYWHDNPKAEAILLIGTAVILTVLVFMGQRVWANIYFADRPTNPIIVEATGSQFQWTFRYPGPDGAFGRLDTRFVSPTDAIGVDPNDPAGRDDIISLNQMHVVRDRPALIRLRANDVIHSLFLPNFRVKQDAVPGMQIEIWFTPNTANSANNAFEIACAELCGLGHYRMKAFMTVDPDEQTLTTWLQQMKAEQ